MSQIQKGWNEIASEIITKAIIKVAKKHSSKVFEADGEWV